MSNNDPIIVSTTPIEYLAEVRKFLTEAAVLQSIQINDFNINITTDWLHSLCSVHCALTDSAVTKNTDITTTSEFDHANPDHLEEVRKYAYQLGNDSKYWLGTGCHIFPNFVEIPILQQLQSALNMFLINVFLKDTQYKIKESVVSSELGIVSSLTDIVSIPDRILTQVGQFINVENTTDILIQLIQHGIFDKKVQTDFIYNGDRLTFPIHLKIKDDDNNEQGVIYILNLNLIQQCSTTRSFRSWVHSMWDQITDLNSRIDNLKCVIQCKSVQCSTELDALNAEIYSLLQQLQAKNLTITDLESQLQGDITTVSSSIEVLHANIEELEDAEKKADAQVKKYSADTPRHELLAIIRNRVQVAEDTEEDDDTQVTEILRQRRELLARATAEKERITAELQSVKHQVECTNLTLQEMKQKAQRLTMKAHMVEQQQQNVKIQQSSLEVMWSKQNATIMSLCKEMETCTGTLDTFQTQRDVQVEQLKSTEDQCNDLRATIGTHVQESKRSSKEQNALLQHMDFIAQETKSLQNEYDEYAIRIQENIEDISRTQKELEQHFANERDLTRSTEDSNIEISKLSDQIIELETRKQKIRYARAQTELLVQSKIQKYINDGTDITEELATYVEYDKVIYELIDRLMRKLESHEHARITMRHRIHLLENRITQMQETVINLKTQIRDLKQTKQTLLNKIGVLKDHLDENVAEKSEHEKYVRFLQHQINLLQTYNQQLVRHQKIYTDHIRDVEQAATDAKLQPIIPSSTADDAQRERTRFLAHLEKLSGILAICKTNYGMRKNIYDVFKLSEILKMCKKLIQIKLRVDKINRTKHFGLSGGPMTKMGATLDLTKFIMASTPAEEAFEKIKKYLRRWSDRWRFWAWKTKGVNRFPRPTQMELMRFEFQMILYKIQKQQMNA